MSGNRCVPLRCSYPLKNRNGVVNIYRNTSTGQEILNTLPSSTTSGEIFIEITYCLNFTNNEEGIDVYCEITLYDENNTHMEPIYRNWTRYICKNEASLSM